MIEQFSHFNQTIHTSAYQYANFDLQFSSAQLSMIFSSEEYMI